MSLRGLADSTGQKILSPGCLPVSVQYIGQTKFFFCHSRLRPVLSMLCVVLTSLTVCRFAFGDEKQNTAPSKRVPVKVRLRQSIKQASYSNEVKSEIQPAISESISNDNLTDSDDIISSDEKTTIALITADPPEPDDVSVPPVPYRLDDQSLEERVRELEARLKEMQLRDEQVSEQLSALGGKKDSKPDPNVLKAIWKHQLNFESPEKNFTVHIGGRTQVETIWLDATPQAIGTGNGFGAQNAVDFRRARLRADGTIYKTIDYVMEYDLVNSVNDNAGLAGQPANATNVINVPAPTDLWWQFREVPIVQNVKVGLQKEPIGLEHLTSSRYLDFMERSYNQDLYTGPFNNGFTPGVAILTNFGEEDQGLIHAGIFKNTDTSPTGIFAYGGSANPGYNYDARISYLLWNECEGRELLHIGASYNHRDPLNDAIRIRSRGSLRNGPGSLNPLYVDTGNFFATNQELAGAELSWISGSFQMQAEYIVSVCTDARSALSGGTSYGNYTTYGYYIMASYFLTGEHREYEKKAGSFGRVIPHANSKLCPQDCSAPRWGAWQILARFADVNLNDNGLLGGLTRDYTIGLNWFLNPNMKIQANYVLTDRGDANPAFVGAAGAGAGWISGFGMRLAHDF